MTKKEALKKLEDILKTHTTLDAERISYLCERIYFETIEPAIRDETEAWIRLSKFPNQWDS